MKKNFVNIDFENKEETFGLSWQAVAAIMLAVQKGMVESLRGNEFDVSECIFDLQLVERGPEDGQSFADDPGLYVINPPAFKPLTPEELTALAEE